MNEKYTITGIPVTQNRESFYLGKVSIKQLFTFTRYTARLIIAYDEECKPVYNKEVQRTIENDRVNKIADYLIYDPDAVFPSNLVLNIPDQVIESIDEDGVLTYITLDEKVFSEVKKEKEGDIFVSVIDGQHRLKGIETAIERLKNETYQLSFFEPKNEADFKKQRLEDLMNIEIIVSFFIDKSLESQAMIFSTINRTQKRVSQDLVLSLFGLKVKDTPYKSALEICLALNSRRESPFFQRIKLYGGKYPKGQSRPLSQATLIRSIVSLICENMRESEKDIHKSREQLTATKKFLPFRKYYAANQDSKISDIIFFYFKAVRECFRNKTNGLHYWDYDMASNPTNILQTTVGFEALIKILVDILESDLKTIDKVSKNYFMEYLSKADDLDFEDQSIFPFSTKGKNILYLSLHMKIWKNLSSSEIDDREKRLNELIQSI